MSWIEHQRKYQRRQQRYRCSFETPCIPVWWLRSSQCLDKPVSHQYILKKQNVLSCSNKDTAVLSAFEIRLIQAAKCKSSSCLCVVVYLPSIAGVKVWKAKTDFRVIRYVFSSTPINSHVCVEESLPSMHCNHTQWTFCGLVKSNIQCPKLANPQLNTLSF